MFPAPGLVLYAQEVLSNFHSILTYITDIFGINYNEFCFTLNFEYISIMKIITLISIKALDEDDVTK